MRPVKLLQVMVASALMFVVTGASAVMLSLVYTGANAQTSAGDIIATTGDVLTFDVILDTQDRVLISGGFNLTYDADNLTFLGLTSDDLGDPNLSRLPDELPGQLEGWAFGTFDGLSGIGRVGTVTFELTGAASTQNPVLISLMNIDGLNDPWIDGVDFITPVNPEFGSVRIVPIPAAVWLLLSAIAGLTGLRGRSARSR